MIGRTLAAGKLCVEARIGSTALGTVYKARHRELRTPIAVELLHPSLRSEKGFDERFRTEALAASHLDHHNLVRVYDFGEEPDGILYVTMELLEGTDLRSVLEEERILGAARAIEIVLQVCAGLGHAHARGIIHSDIKPENVQLIRCTDDDGQDVEHVKVGGLGIARAPASHRSRSVAGTPHYMSPEQCRGAALDARSDVYACGVLLYELVTGRVPFDGAASTVIAQHLGASVVPPSRHDTGIDGRLERLVLRMLAKERGDRPRDMRELRAELIALRASVRIEPRRASVPAPASWFEERTAVYATFLTGTSAGASEASSLPPPALVPPGWSCASAIAELVATREARAFAALVARLGDVVAGLVARRDVGSLWRLACTLDGIASEGGAVPDARATAAAHLAERFSDPSLLAEIASDLLAGSAGTAASPAMKLLVRAGAPGARAAYTARIRHRGRDARACFVAVVASLGEHAEPVILAALERLEPRLRTEGATEVACDLLDALQPTRSAPLAELVVRLATVAEPTVAAAATAALPRALGQRARPILVTERRR